MPEIFHQDIYIGDSSFTDSILVKHGFFFFPLTATKIDLLICGTCVDFRILYEEIDYINEGKNADRFRRDFRNIKWVRVPVCDFILCDSKLITF